MAAAPAIVRFVGGDVPFALRDHPTDVRDHRRREPGLPGARSWSSAARRPGIDVTAVARTGILPQINTGMAGRVAGTGQVGAGLVTPPAECFTQALAALALATATKP